MNPILYDFKRTFIRFMTLSLVLIFLVIGLSLSYYFYSSYVLAHRADFVNLNDIAIIKNATDGNLIAIVFVFNNLGNPIPNAMVNIEGKSGITNSSGYAVISEIPKSGVIEVEYKGQTISESYNSIGVFAYASKFTSASNGMSAPMLTILSNSRIENLQGNNYLYYVVSASHNGKATLIVGTLKKNITVSYVFSRINSSISLISHESIVVTTSSMFLNTTRLLLTNYVNVFTIKTPNYYAYLDFAVIGPDNSSAGTGSTFYPDGVGVDDIISSLENDAAAYETLFPLLIIYFSYVMLVRPRDSGALLFLLSKPITRRQIYINRLLAGFLTVLVGSLIYSLVVYVILDYLVLNSTGVFIPVSVLLINFLNNAITFVTFYSLLLMFPVIIKTARVNFGIYVFLYFLFTVGWQFIDSLVSDNTAYALAYFNPIQLGYLITSWYNALMNIGPAYSSLSLPLIVLSASLWIIIPFLIAIWRIQKIDI